jgi:hypothetical protein
MRPILTEEERREREIQQLKERAYREMKAACEEIIPLKFRDVRSSELKPSPKSRLPLEAQAKLYADINAKPLEGWAFFAPAGYSKTTCSWALYKHALWKNLKWAIQSGQQEWVRHDDSRHVQYWTPCYCWHVIVPEWLAQIQASWDEESRVLPPALSFDKFPKAEKQGFRPRVFLEEIDKCKEGSEWATNQFFMLINAVDKHKGQLVLDTNLSKRQFLDRFGEPIYRRVKENCNVREFGFQ